jgi:hypothetical protein
MHSVMYSLIAVSAKAVEGVPDAADRADQRFEQQRFAEPDSRAAARRRSGGSWCRTVGVPCDDAGPRPGEWSAPQTLYFDREHSQPTIMPANASITNAV